MLIKFANADVLEARVAKTGGALMRTAHKAVFNYEPREGFLYVRSRAISNRTNDNYDSWPEDELRQAWGTFIGKPVFVNHHNEDHRRMRGVIIDAALHEDTGPDGRPDVWIEVLMEIDAIRFPKLAEAILEGDIERTSMGADVGESECSYCGNVAVSPLQYCSHIKRNKGQRLSRRNPDGTNEEVLVHEICRKISFFENSVLVEPPADPTAFFLGVDDAGVRSLGMTKSASIARQPGWYSVEISAPYGYDDEWREDFREVGFGNSRTTINGPFADAPSAGYGAQYFDGVNWSTAKTAGRLSSLRTAAEKQYVLVSGVGTGENWELHIDGCKDLSMPKYQIAYKEPMSGESAAAVVDMYLDEQMRDQGYTEEDFRIFPCAGGRSKGADGRVQCPAGGDRVRFDNANWTPTCYLCGARADVAKGKGTYKKHWAGPQLNEPPCPRSGVRLDKSEVNCTECGLRVSARAFSDMPSHKRGDRLSAMAGRISEDAYVSLSDQQKARFQGTTVRQDDKGFYCHTHRARGKSHPSVDEIPDSEIAFIESTGSRSDMTTKTAAPEVKVDEFKDYGTGFVKVRAEIAVPGFDYESALPSTISVEAQEWATKKWLVRLVIGPYNTRDARGSYYDASQVGDFEGTKSEAIAMIKRELKTRFAEWAAGPMQRDAALHDLTYGPTTPGRDAGTRWEGVPTDGTGYSVVVTWPGDEVGLLSAVVKDLDRAQEWAQSCYAAGAATVLVKDNAAGKYTRAERTASIKTAVEWVPTDEDPRVQWTLTDGDYASIYATVIDDSFEGTDADYEVPHLISKWNWIVHKLDTGEELAWGTARSETDAKRKAELALAASNSTKNASIKTAYGETKAPPKVNTLGLSECAVCGTENQFDSTGRCTVCGFLPAPEPFREPDLEVAQKIDMRDGWVNPDLMSAPAFVPPDEAPEEEGGDQPGTPEQKVASLDPVHIRMTAQEAVEEGDPMRPSQIVTAQREASESRRLRAENAQLRTLVASLRKRADEENPAQPVPEPGSESASQSTGDTRSPDTTTEVTTPGGVMPAPAPAATTEVTTPGAAITDTAPEANATVTAPVSGGAEVPSYEQSVTLIDPVAGTPADTSNAFEDGEWATTGARRVQARTFAEIRLARLRIQAGLDEGDDLVVAQKIAASGISDEALRTEITTLSRVSRQQPRQAVARRTTAARGVPSLVSSASPSFGPTPSMGISDDELGFF